MKFRIKYYESERGWSSGNFYSNDITDEKEAKDEWDKRVKEWTKETTEATSAPDYYIMPMELQQHNGDAWIKIS